MKRALGGAVGAALALVLGVAPALGAPASVDPLGLGRVIGEPRPDDRPNVFWWWPGAEVEPAETAADIAALKRAGFGSAQIIDLEGGPVQGGGLEWQWGSPAWFARFREAVEQGTRSGIRIDASSYPIWPMTSPAVREDPEVAQHGLHYGVQDVQGPSELITPPPDAATVVGGKRLVAVSAARLVEGTERELDPRSAVDLTDRVGSEGLLRWSVPPGHWKLFGFWRRPTGQVPQSFGGFTRTPTLDQAPPGGFPSDRFVVDHFSAAAARSALAWIDRNAPPELAAARRQNGGHLYEDSLELSVGIGSGILWPRDFLTEFRARRGYALTPFLAGLFYPRQHALFAALHFFKPPGFEDDPNFQPGVGAEGNPDFTFSNGLGDRVRHDYYRTLTDLYIERLKALDEWRRARGLTGFRHQSFGTTIDSSRAMTAVGIPDTETFEPGSPHPPGSAGSQATLHFYRIASGAAHISGVDEVNAETGDVFAFGSCPKDICVYGQEPDDYWRIVNHAYAGGVTHIQLHGLSYQKLPPPPRTSSWLGPQSWPWPGWSAMYNAFTEPWNRNWPQWSFWRPFTTYMGRAAAVLTRGRPRVDLLLVRDDFVYGVGGLPPTRRRQALIRRGWTYDVTDPVTLAERGAVKGRRLFPRGPAYKALVIDSDDAWTHGLAGETVGRIQRLARHGLPVVFVGDPPERGTSAADPAAEDAQVRDAMARLVRRRNVRVVRDAARVPAALRSLGVRPDAAWSGPALVHAVHRRTDRQDLFYLWNEADEPVALTASLATRGAPYRVDLWNGRTERIGRFRRRRGTMRVPLRLGPQQATLVAVDRRRRAPLHVVATTADAVRVTRGRLALQAARPGIYRATLSDGTRRRVRIRSGERTIEPAQWELDVEEFSPDGAPRHHRTLSELRDWQDIPGLQNIAGTATYRTTLDVPPTWLGRRTRVELDAGTAHGASRLTVNGRLVTRSTIRLPGERHDVTALLRPGRNDLEVVLATPPLNKLRGLGLSGDPRYVPFATIRPNPAGLIGPVRLVRSPVVPLPGRARGRTVSGRTPVLFTARSSQSSGKSSPEP